MSISTPDIVYTSHDYFNRLPDDLLSYFFLRFCGPFFRDPEAFALIRRALYMVCRRWYHLIQDMHLLWSSILVGRVQSLALIAFFFSKVPTGLLKITLQFNEPVFLSSSPHHHPPLPAIINAVLPHLHRAVALVIYAADTDALTMISRGMRNVLIPRLETLVVRRHAWTSIRVPGYAAPRILFCRPSMLLTAMVLSILPFDTSSLPPLPHLVELVLRDICPENFPSCAALLRLFSATPNVLRLSLENMGVRRLSSLDCSIAVLPLLRELHVAFRGQDSSAALLRFLQLGPVRILYVSLSSESDLRMLVVCSRVLASVEELRLDGKTPSQAALTTLFLSVPSLRLFHFPYIGHRVLSALDDAATILHPHSPSELALSHLAHLGIASIPPQHVLPFVRRWKSFQTHPFSGITLWNSSSPSLDLADPSQLELERLVLVDYDLAYPVAGWRFCGVALPD
ncbi:hypothetical protein C8R43DRAFT_1120232 [Mycena crocata]|nr:hypothetical protein C8R43DRAFT_1120232 [Mycena crocata]